jgi:hypothetical protein
MCVDFRTPKSYYLTIEQSPMDVSDFHWKAIEKFVVQQRKASSWSSVKSVVADLAK